MFSYQAVLQAITRESASTVPSVSARQFAAAIMLESALEYVDTLNRTFAQYGPPTPMEQSGHLTATATIELIGHINAWMYRRWEDERKEEDNKRIEVEAAKAAADEDGARTLYDQQAERDILTFVDTATKDKEMLKTLINNQSTREPSSQSEN